MFWGTVIPPKSKVTIKPKFRFHLTHAALELPTSRYDSTVFLGQSAPAERQMLWCSFDSKSETEQTSTNIILGSLSEGHMEQLSLNIVFGAAQSITFTSTGSTPIHLSGTLCIPITASTPVFDASWMEVEKTLQQPVNTITIDAVNTVPSVSINQCEKTISLPVNPSVYNQMKIDTTHMPKKNNTNNHNKKRKRKAGKNFDNENKNNHCIIKKEEMVEDHTKLLFSQNDNINEPDLQTVKKRLRRKRRLIPNQTLDFSNTVVPLDLMPHIQTDSGLSFHLNHDHRIDFNLKHAGGFPLSPNQWNALSQEG